jgi:hypothetical protein
VDGSSLDGLEGLVRGSPSLRTTRARSFESEQAQAWGPGRGFTIIDILVSIAVIAVLISILMPSLSLVRETTRRLVCSSNIRQHGMGLALYAEDYQGVLPPTGFLATDAHRLTTVRFDTSSGSQNQPTERWDGMGWLFRLGYLDAPGVYYCPSYRGEHRLSLYAGRWSGQPGEIVTNYHYRGRVPGRSELTLFSQPNIAVAADALVSQSEFAHESGANVLRIDLAVAWFSDAGGRLVSRLPSGGETDPVASNRIGEAWLLLDQAGLVPGQ